MLKRRSVIAQNLMSKKNSMKAVILRDMRTRFFNHGLGFLLVSLWPMAHIVILLILNSVLGRAVPYGDSPYLFFATGLIPTLAFTYVSRFMCLSVILNRPMLGFPIVKVTDIIFGRAALEIIGAFITLVFVLFILICIGVSPSPRDYEEAVEAYCATLMLAVGVGALASVITMIIPFFATIYALFMILIYISSGSFFVASALPEQVIDIISWNPVVHSVEWVRYAYFPGYSTHVLDKKYLIGFSLVSMFLGLFIERVFRKNVLDS